MIRYHRQAEKFILSQGKAVALRLYNAIEKIPLGDIKRLQGQNDPPLYRLRVGDYRVIFCAEGDDVLVLRIDNRGDAYKGL